MALFNTNNEKNKYHPQTTTNKYTTPIPTTEKGRTNWIKEKFERLSGTVLHQCLVKQGYYKMVPPWRTLLRQTTPP